MLYINTKVYHVPFTTDKTRAIREYHMLDQEIEVQADGDELQHIADTMSNIPMSQKRVVRWTGETARFIVDNL